MRKLSYLLGILWVLLLAEIVWAAGQSGLVTMNFDISAQPAGEEVRLWIPYPVSDQDQLISEVKVTGDFRASAVYTDPGHGNPILFASWDKGAKSRKLTLSFHAQRQEVLRRNFPTKETCWDPADYQAYLKATKLGPIDGEVKKLANTITKGQNTVQAKAKAIYDWICQNMYRDPDTRGCGTGDVCALLKKPGGKCTDISSVYVALARAAGVPAREIFGLRLGKKPEEDITQYQHCWAEFYLPGYGWVPVDPADVRKAMLVEKLQPKDPKTRAYEEYFWGGIDQYRIKLAEGRDLILNPPQSGEALNTFGYPFAQVGTRTLDWLEPATFKYQFIWKTQ
ncbi:MAG: transglutaminase domain-containing protein [Deltaproteobacteria bacterium]|nr:transglutaminase domain-containing protein [Deltaproteobacteria bacterium]MBI4795183.1 transglutaminase domain-containing protein [Deltaproteobacteria bacterium]